MGILVELRWLEPSFGFWTLVECSRINRAAPNMQLQFGSTPVLTYHEFKYFLIHHAFKDKCLSYSHC
jgi:hypothetical protein